MVARLRQTDRFVCSNPEQFKPNPGFPSLYQGLVHWIGSRFYGGAWQSEPPVVTKTMHPSYRCAPYYVVLVPIFPRNISFLNLVPVVIDHESRSPFGVQDGARTRRLQES